ncbi:MAG: tyrosine-protein phosphatase [Deltaproteobacteria bacterium]|nr:tyrosine-protein phosphatase [Deltaproteobacteria bacterium]
MIKIDVEAIDKTSIKVEWSGIEPGRQVFVFLGTSQSTIDRKNPVAVSTSGHTRITGLDPLNRYYFEISVDGKAGVIAAPRRVIMDGAVNFRDLGGYATKDGRQVKWGRVFRADGLARLSDVDLKRMVRMKITRVFDLRSAAEMADAPDRLPDNRSIKHVHVPVTHGDFDFVEAMKRIKAGDTSWLTDDFMVKGYINNIESFPLAWGRIIGEAADAGKGPLVFHCTGGKDRTGTCAALLLLALGVDEETVIYDHQLSNIYIRQLLPQIYEMMASYGIDPEILFPYLTAPRECVEALLEHIRKNYGSATGYLVERGGMIPEEIERIKQGLLEK